MLSKPLSSDSYEIEQTKTLATSREKYGIISKILFTVMDMVYGKEASLSKFKVLEIVARVPYQAWENIAYIAMTHTYRSPAFARNIFKFVEEARAHQDNEQWHLLIIQELTQKLGIKEGWLKFIIIPQILAFTYYYISWLLYVVKPKLSYQLNAEFEDHAEHEYMNFTKDPQWSQSGYSGGFSKDYGTFETLKDLWIQIGLDERAHKQDSLSKLDSPRFGIRRNN